MRFFCFPHAKVRRSDSKIHLVADLAIAFLSFDDVSLGLTDLSSIDAIVPDVEVHRSPNGPLIFMGTRETVISQPLAALRLTCGRVAALAIFCSAFAISTEAWA